MDLHHYSTRLLWAGILVLSFNHISVAQGVGINPTGQPPHSGAILDVSSAQQGVLLPRTLPASIIDPAEGMVIYDTLEQVFKYYTGMSWVALMQQGAYSFWWADQDGDGFGYAFNVVYSPTAPEHYVGNNDDCNDSDPNVNSASLEICDGIDNDCDGMIDEGNPGGGAICGSNIGQCQQGILTCSGGILVCLGGVEPSPEVCDDIDNDCDGITDEEIGPFWWPDLDQDLYGDANEIGVQACSPPGFHVGNNLDCNDLNPAINPGAQEICDGIDNDCNGVQDDGAPCTDGEDCTDDLCIGGTCVFTIQANKCLINGICYDANDPNPSNECEACVPSTSQTQWTILAGATCAGGTGICNSAGVCITP